MTTPIGNLTASWLNSSNTYTGIGMSVTSIGESAASRLLQLSYNSTIVFDVSKNSFYTLPTTVSGLPAASIGLGRRAFVTDSSNDFSNNVTGIVVTGGGSTPVPVYSDGTYWRIG